LSTAQDFHDAIIASPDDDTPRLAYADWLDEQGDTARAEFIRVQIALARIGEDDERRKDLRARERKLQEANADTWLGEADRMLKSCRFDRGLLEVIHLRHPFDWERAADLFRTCPIRELSLGIRTADGARRLASSAWLSRLTKLCLAGSYPFFNAGFADVFASPYLANLRELSLIGHRAGPEVVAALVRCGVIGLRALSLIDEDIGVTGAASLAGWTGLAGISHLDLGENELGPPGVEALLAAGRPSQLASLDFCHNDVTASAARTIARTECLSDLETLNLGNNPLGNDGIGELTRSPHLRLRALDVRSVSCDQAAASGIARSRFADRLGRLDLSFNPLGPAGAVALAESHRLGGLGDLELAHCEIGSEGVQALAESPYLRRLKKVVLSGNDVRTRGIEALTESPNFGALRELELNEAQLNDRSARALARWPGLAGLHCLKLSGNNIGDDGARALAASPYIAGIEWLCISGENLTGEGLEALRAAGVKHVNR
jgi:uncharacterized protein (TIGR02996 family)